MLTQQQIDEGRRLHDLGYSWREVGMRLGLKGSTVRVNCTGRTRIRYRKPENDNNRPICGAGADSTFVHRHTPRTIKTVIRRDMDAVRAFAAGQISRAELVARLTP